MRSARRMKTVFRFEDYAEPGRLFQDQPHSYDCGIWDSYTRAAVGLLVPACVLLAGIGLGRFIYLAFFKRY
jgi:hypothetical protein